MNYILSLTEKDGKPETKVQDKVPDEVINKISDLVAGGNTFDEALGVIRSQAVPLGYTPTAWKAGATQEDPGEKMRSIIFTYRFRHEVQRLKEQGRDFTKSVHMPEIDPRTGKKKHARGDHNHLMKRIGFHTRDGGPDDVDVRKLSMHQRTRTQGLPGLHCWGSASSPQKMPRSFFPPKWLTSFTKRVIRRRETM